MANKFIVKRFVCRSSKQIHLNQLGTLQLNENVVRLGVRSLLNGNKT